MGGGRGRFMSVVMVCVSKLYDEKISITDIQFIASTY